MRLFNQKPPLKKTKCKKRGAVAWKKLLAVTIALAAATSALRGQSALDGFDPNANGVVRIVVVQPDGKILIGGYFTTLAPMGSGVTRNHIARLNPDGTLDTAFNPNARNPIRFVTQSRCRRTARFWWAEILPALADRRATKSRGLMPRPAWLIRLIRRDDTVRMAIAVQADGKILVGG